MTRIRSLLGTAVTLVAGTLASILLLGCVASTYTRVYESLPAKSKGEAENLPILTQNPRRAYRVIADSQFANISESGVRKWAASVGADAVLVAASTSVTTTSATSSHVGPEVQNEPIRLGSGQQVFCTAIKYEQ
jgi:hypothetical protein